MKTTSTACAALLNSTSQAFMVELYTLTLFDGTQILWANSDTNITYSARTWNRGPVIVRNDVVAEVGITVQTCTVGIYADGTTAIHSVPLLQAARAGALDGARLLIQKGFTSDPAVPIAGLVHVFEGRIGNLQINSVSVQADVNTDNELLDTQIPLHAYQPSCLNTLYDAKCTINKAANSINLTCSAGTTTSLIQCAVTGAGVYDLGTLVFITGINAGVSRSVKIHTSGQLLLSYPLVTAPAPGDQFTVSKGCNKTMSTCSGTFSNIVHFKGQPYVPLPETVI